MRIAVVGAGLSGLAAARELARAGHDVTVFDKGRSPGGRLATRRIGGATFDHGAQFFTVRDAALAAQVGDWMARGLVRVWCHGFGTEPDGQPRYVAAAGMTSLAKDLARGLDVRCNHLVFTIRPDPGGGWVVTIDDGQRHEVDAVVVTSPVPQTFSLLFEAGVELPMELFGADYERTIALLAVLDAPSAVPAPGGLQAERLAGTCFSFVGDNQRKGVSAVPALTLHATAEWSQHRWDDDRDVVAADLLREAAPFTGPAAIVDHQVKRWRFATPRRIWPDPCWVDDTGSLVLAGDAFAGPRVEGAYESGLAAAAALNG